MSWSSSVSDGDGEAAATSEVIAGETGGETSKILSAIVANLSMSTLSLVDANINLWLSYSFQQLGGFSVTQLLWCKRFCSEADAHRISSVLILSYGPSCGCNKRSCTSWATSGCKDDTTYAKWVLWLTMPLVTNWASTWANQMVGSLLQKGGNFKLLELLKKIPEAFLHPYFNH